MIAPAAISPGMFAALAWGAIALVAGVFGYEIYAVARETRQS
jgi:hypothetical protein